MQYKTYQEAKVANPDREIYYSAARRLGDKGLFSTRENATGLHHECHPKDYCMTLKNFLAGGRRAVKGDVIVGKDGKAIAVESEYIINMPTEADCGIYVVKAKALEEPAHEWANGDECVHVDYPNCVYIYIGKHPHKDGGYVFQEDRVVGYVDNSCLRKPETTEQKLDRQRLESAYHLACIAGAVDKWGGEFTFDNFKQDWEAVKRWLAIVDETKYTKG